MNIDANRREFLVTEVLANESFRRDTGLRFVTVFLRRYEAGDHSGQSITRDDVDATIINANGDAVSSGAFDSISDEAIDIAIAHWNAGVSNVRIAFRLNRYICEGVIRASGGAVYAGALGASPPKAYVNWKSKAQSRKRVFEKQERDRDYAARIREHGS